MWGSFLSGKLVQSSIHGAAKADKRSAIRQERSRLKAHFRKINPQIVIDIDFYPVLKAVGVRFDVSLFQQE